MMWSSIYRYRLASPSSSAPVLYGFPAGRPFRVIGRSAGFAHIQDLKSSASGWIDEAALAPTTSAPVRSAPSQPKPYSVSRIPPNPWAGPTPKVTVRSLRTPEQPLNRVASALACSVAGVFSGVSSATVISFRLLQTFLFQTLTPAACEKAVAKRRELEGQTGLLSFQSPAESFGPKTKWLRR